MSRSNEYAVEIEGWGHRSTIVTSARSRAQARYLAWFEISEPTCVSFGDFLNSWVKSVRKTTSAVRYDYIREHYGLDVAVGDPVIAHGRAGVVAVPPAANARHSYVYVLTDSVDPYHPSEVIPT